MDIPPDEQIDPRLAGLDRWISNLRWYDKLPLVLSLTILTALPVGLLNVVAENAVASRQSSGAVVRSGMGVLPDMLRTTEIYVVACRNAGESTEIARAVATIRAVQIANEYGAQVPKLVSERIEEQIRKHYGRPPAVPNDKVMWLNNGCDLR